jgi:hypothetical protein
MNIIKNLGEKVLDIKDNTQITFNKISSIFTKNDCPYMKLQLKLKLNQIFRKDKNDNNNIDPKDKDFILAILQNFYDKNGNIGSCKNCKYEITIYNNFHDNLFFNSNLEEHSIECLLKYNHNVISMYKIYQQYY